MVQNGQYVYPSAIRFPDFSVNREEFSEPEDVLLHNYPDCLGWGIAAFRVKDLPLPVQTEKNTEYIFFIFCQPRETPP